MCGDTPTDGECHHKLNSQREHVLGREPPPHSAHLTAKVIMASVGSVPVLRAQCGRRCGTKRTALWRGDERDGAKQSPGFRQGTSEQFGFTAGETLSLCEGKKNTP